MYKIIQIIPANGWKAMFAIKPEESSHNPYFLQDIICWALYSEDDKDSPDVYNYVKGLTSSDVPAWIDNAEATNNFITYISPNDDPNLWKDSCLKYLEKNIKK